MFTRIEQQKYQSILGDTKVGPLFDHILPAVFSPDSRHYLFIGASQAPHNIAMRVIHDGAASEAYDYIDSEVFSPDSAHAAYRVRTHDDKWFIVLDGKPQKTYRMVGAPFFSPDSQTLAYQSVQNDSALMVINGKEYAYIVDNPLDHNAAKISRPCFSPDGRHVAYLVKPKPLECILAVDGTIIETIDFIVSQELDPPIVFDVNNKARVWAGKLEDGRLVFYLIDITIDNEPKKNK